MAAADDVLALRPGYSFCPADTELTDNHLHRKINASKEFAASFDARFFHEADVYSAEPEKLVQPFLPAPGTGKGDKPPAWYFFSPARYAGKKKSSGRRSRTIDGDGSKNWHSEKTALPVEGGSAFGGSVQKLSYMVKNKASGKSERAGWIMAEYGISPEHGGGSLVLCKVYPSTYAHKTLPVLDSPAINLRKRKAAAADHPEAPTTNVRPRNESETYYGDLDANMYPNTRWLTPEQAAAYLPIVYERGPDGFGIPDCTSFDPTPSFSFWQQMEVSGGDLATPPYAPAAQPEEDAAETITGDDQNNVIDHRPFGFWQEMEQEYEASYPISNSEVVDGSAGGDLGTEDDAAALVQTISDGDQNNDGALTTTQLDEPAANEVIYGLPCPDFAPEMLRKCMDDTTPWPSPTSLSLLLST